MKLRKFLPIIGIAIFIYILFKLDLKNIFTEISNADIFFLIIAIIFTGLYIITQTLKWFAIARVQKINIGFLEAIRINLISDFYGFVTPSRIGVAMRADYLRKYNCGQLGKGLSNYTLDKILDICSLVFITIFAIATIDFISKGYIYYFGAGFILLVIGLLIFRDKERGKKIMKIFYKLLPKKIKERAKDGFYSFYQDMPKKRYFILFFLLNILNWIILYATTFFIGVSLGIDVSFFYFLVILPIATLVSQLPITIGGLGTREAMLIYLFGILGVEATKIFSMSIISLAIGIIPILIGSLLIFKKR